MKKMFMKTISVLALCVTMLINAVPAFAQEVQPEIEEVQVEETYYQPAYSYSKVFTFREYAFNEPHIMQVDVEFTIAYTYDEGNWYYINYGDIDVNAAYIDGRRVGIDSVEYEANSDHVYRVVEINGNILIRIWLTVDEYGDVNESAYIL